MNILEIVMCKTEKNMAETEEYDAIGLNIALEFRKELSVSSKANESRPTPHAATNTDTTTTTKSTA